MKCQQQHQTADTEDQSGKFWDSKTNSSTNHDFDNMLYLLCCPESGLDAHNKKFPAFEVSDCFLGEADKKRPLSNNRVYDLIS